MSKEVNIARNISNLRKQNNVTQEQLANAIKVSPQAVSKWEKSLCMPDTSIIPRIADFFNVSIDYLFYGTQETNDEIYEEIKNRVASKDIETKEQYTEALKLSLAVHHGILRGCEISDKTVQEIPIEDQPIHLLDLHGLSVSSPQGFSAIVTKDFINSINGKTMKRAKKIFEALANVDCLRVTTEIINFPGISIDQLKDKTGFDEERLINAIKVGIKAQFIEVRKSFDTAVRTRYCIQRHHYNCLCLILSSVKMIEISLDGCSRLMRYSNFSISFDEEQKSPLSVESSSVEEK